MLDEVMGPTVQAEHQAPFSSILQSALDGRYVLVIDARSQREYAEDHLPCAVNLLVVDNEEYAEVGTTHGERRVPAVIDTATREFEVAVKILVAKLANRPYLVGASFTVADILAAHTLLWAKSARLPLGSDNLETYLQTVTSRDAFRRARRATEISELASPDIS